MKEDERRKIVKKMNEGRGKNEESKQVLCESIIRSSSSRNK
jgi:hypothetical protein